MADVDSKSLAQRIVDRVVKNGKPIGYRADREPDASWYRPSPHKPPKKGEIEYRRREEDRIQKMKDSFYFKSQKFFGREEEDILKQMEEEEKRPSPIMPRPSWSK